QARAHRRRFPRDFANLRGSPAAPSFAAICGVGFFGAFPILTSEAELLAQSLRSATMKKKLKLNKSTLRSLVDENLNRVVGGRLSAGCPIQTENLATCGTFGVYTCETITLR